MQVAHLNQEQVGVRLATSHLGIDLYMDSRFLHRRSNTTKIAEQFETKLFVLLLYLSVNRLFARYKSLAQAAQAEQPDSTLVQVGSRLAQAGSKRASHSTVPHSMGTDNV
ncbi:MAG: hypothetical protein WAT12_07225 [Candidatus Nitrotoga sp.]